MMLAVKTFKFFFDGYNHHVTVRFEINITGEIGLFYGKLFEVEPWNVYGPIVNTASSLCSC